MRARLGECLGGGRRHAVKRAVFKLSTAVKTGDMQTAIVAQIMLDSGNDKLNGAMKQLLNATACKEKVQSKLMKAQGSVVTTIEISPPPWWLATTEPTPPPRCFTVFSAVFLGTVY